MSSETDKVDLPRRLREQAEFLMHGDTHMLLREAAEALDHLQQENEKLQKALGYEGVDTGDSAGTAATDQSGAEIYYSGSNQQEPFWLQSGVCSSCGRTQADVEASGHTEQCGRDPIRLPCFVIPDSAQSPRLSAVSETKQLAEAEARIAALTTERDTQQREIHRLREQIAEASLRWRDDVLKVEALIAALRTYGQHADNCPAPYCTQCGYIDGISHDGSEVEAHPFTSEPCTCGLAALLAASEVK